MIAISYAVLGAHMHVTVRSGPSDGHRPLNGTLIFDIGEGQRFVDALRLGLNPALLEVTNTDAAGRSA
jgi:hypothetical protein